MSDVTRILDRVEQGDTTATDELLPLVYEELRKLAAHKIANEAPGQCRPFHLSESLRLTRLMTDRFPNSARCAREAPESEMMVGKTLLSLGRTREGLPCLDDSLKHVERSGMHCTTRF